MRFGVEPRWVILCLMFLYTQCKIGADVEASRTLALRAAPADERLGRCPLNVTELDSHTWIIERCKISVEVNHCCQALHDLIRILFFSWLHATGSFLLPDEATAVMCLKEFRQHLGLQERIVNACHLQSDNFLSSTDSCDNIRDKSSFERSVDTSGMHEQCNGSGPVEFDCFGCLRAMASAFGKLNSSKHSGGKKYCEVFVTMYVGGGMNYYEDLGPDEAYCVMSATLLRPSSSSVNVKRNYSEEKTHRNIKIALGIVIPAVTIMLVLGLLVFLRRQRWCYCVKGSRAMHRLSRRQVKLFRESMQDADSGLVFFSLSQIKACTGNFMASNVIGEGGFSTVYKGSLPNGSQIAIKRFKDSTIKANTDFRHEVQVISSVKHQNLLPLRGYFVGSNEIGVPEHFLIYDYMANGSLADYLFRNKKPCLTWPQRYNIAVGIARGLAYLHEDAKPAIIHRDIKAANVLLDADLNPLVSDFGTAKLKHDKDKTHYTTQAVGTLGYVAPEYALYGHLTDKSDTFSFGILLLELMSGRKALDFASGNLELLLISDWACDLIHKGMSEEVIDKRIRGSGPKQSMDRVILLALQCAHPRVACRPSILQALLILEAIGQPQPQTHALGSIEQEAAQALAVNTIEDLDWLVSPDMDRNIHSQGSASVTMGSTSTDSDTK
eukprot:Gb_04638 [translate_table: standard]